MVPSKKKDLPPKRQDVNKTERLFALDHRAEHIEQLTSDFPEIIDRIYIDRMLSEVRRIARVERKHSISLEGMLEGRIDVAEITRILLPYLYCCCRDVCEGEDKWTALQKAYLKLIGVLRYLKDNLECLLLQGLEEAVNLTLHEKGEFGLSLAEVRRFIQKKYWIPIKRGRRSLGQERKKGIRKTYSQIMMRLAPSFSSGIGKVAAISETIEWCNDQLDSTRTMDFEATQDTLCKSRSQKEIAKYLTARMTSLSVSSVGRILRK